LSETESIIFDCVDSTLSQLGFVNKLGLYTCLEKGYGIKPQEIGKNFELFHDLIKQFYGVNHYKIERLMIRVLHEGAKQDNHVRGSEIQAFSLITTVFTKDIKENMERNKELADSRIYAKRLEERVRAYDNKLRSAERMAAIGETAAMVGHDIRNPLQSIVGDLYLIQQELEEANVDKQSIIDSVNSISCNVDYISKIVQDLQDFARPLNPELRNTDLTNILNAVFTSACLPEKIKLELDVKVSCMVRTDPLFLRRALTNLVNNSVQAMPNGGKLAIKAYVKENKLLLTVSDTGKGIPDEVKKNIFKPLVTTKAKGQGFGLAVVKRLIDALGGTISFRSKVGKGTKFQIELPTK